MANARITSIGLYNHDSTIFRHLILPDGVDVGTAVNRFLLKYGECPVLYPDPAFYTFAVKIFSDSHREAIERIYAALSEEYNPLHNYDRHEEWTDKPDLMTENSGSDVVTTDMTRTDSLTDETHMQRTDDLTGENKVSAYNVSTYQPDTETLNTGTVDNDGTVDHTGTVENDGTVTTAHGHKVTTSGKTDHTGHIWGNVGTTKSQDMAKDEVELRSEYNIYDVIADLMRADLCLYVY